MQYVDQHEYSRCWSQHKRAVLKLWDRPSSPAQLGCPPETTAVKIAASPQRLALRASEAGIPGLVPRLSEPAGGPKTTAQVTVARPGCSEAHRDERVTVWQKQDSRDSPLMQIPLFDS